MIAVLAFAVSVITGPANSFVFLFAQNFLHQRGMRDGRHGAWARAPPDWSGCWPDGGWRTALAGA